MPPVQYVQITANQLLHRGLELVGFQGQRQGATKLKLRRFFAAYGVSPPALKALFDDLQPTVDDPDLRFFLIAVFWLKAYIVEELIAGFFGLTEKSARKEIWKYISAIQAQGEKIIWPDFTSFEEVFAGTVDTIHCRVLEQRRKPSARWCSYKFKQPAVSYEVALHMWEDRCISVRGPFKGGTKDPAIFMGYARTIEEEAAKVEDDNQQDDDIEDVNGEENEDGNDYFEEDAVPALLRRASSSKWYRGSN